MVRELPAGRGPSRPGSHIVDRLRNDRRALDPATKSGNYLNSVLGLAEAQDERRNGLPDGERRMASSPRLRRPTCSPDLDGQLVHPTAPRTGCSPASHAACVLELEASTHGEPDRSNANSRRPMCDEPPTSV